MFVLSNAATFIQFPTLEACVENNACYHRKVLNIVNLIGKNVSIVLYI
jgi:hypothetical protein